MTATNIAPAAKAEATNDGSAENHSQSTPWAERLRFVAPDPTDVRKRANLEAIAVELGVLFEDGKAVCPFHDDHEPSLQTFTGDDGVPRYSCFPCAWTGDAIDFVRKASGLDFAEALAFCTEHLDDEARPAPAPGPKREPLDLADLPDDCDPNVLGQYAARKLPAVSIDWLRDEMRLRTNGGRVVFVYARHDGTAAVRSRPADCSTTTKGRKGERLDSLYGVWRLDPDADRPVVIVEGESDLLCAAWLLRDAEVDVVALPGTPAAKTVNLDSIKNRRTVVVALDNDNAGRDAAAVLAERLHQARTVWIAPEGHDLSDLATNGATADQLLDLLGLGDSAPETTPDSAPAPAVHPGSLGDDFWNARPYLAHISQAAHARLVSRTAVLHVVLARVAAFVPYTIRLPALIGTHVPLCYFVAVIAPPGVGKSAANGVGVELLPAPAGIQVADQLPLGSGEGLVEALFEWVEFTGPGGKNVKEKRQIRYNAYIYADEGEALAALAGRSGSTLGATVRTIFTGGTLGNANASAERKRIVPAGHYTYGVVCGFQDVLAGALLDDADGGTPQRFAWAEATDPTIPDTVPDWPGRLNWKRRPLDEGGLYVVEVTDGIRTEIQVAHKAKMRGTLRTDSLDAHRALLRFKIAGLLAVLDGRLDVNAEDWHLAALVLADSDRTRSRVVETVRAQAARKESETSGKLARRQVDATAAVEKRRTIDAARKLAEKVWRSEYRRRDLYRAMVRYRDVFEDALDHAIAEGWVTVRCEPGQGGDKVIVAPGERRPS